MQPQIIYLIPTKEITVAFGDYNARIAKTEITEHLRYIYIYGGKERNERQTCYSALKLAVMNTLFKHYIRKLYTLKSPADRYGIQIDTDKCEMTNFDHKR